MAHPVLSRIQTLAEPFFSLEYGTSQAMQLGTVVKNDEPSRIVLRQGEQVRIELRNDGAILHDLKIEDLSADGIQSQSSGPLSGHEGELFVGAEPGKEGTLVFTPTGTGAFTYYCTIPQHRQLGMKGVMVVE